MHNAVFMSALSQPVSRRTRLILTVPGKVTATSTYATSGQPKSGIRKVCSNGDMVAVQGLEPRTRGL